MPIELSTIFEGLGLGKLLEIAWDKLGHRIKVKEIRKHHDGDIDETLEVYERLFNEEHRVPAADLVEWLRHGKSTHVCKDSLQQCLLIAKRNGSVVGLLKAIYCPQSSCVLISYFCIDKKSDTVTRKVASKIILRFFNKFLNKKWGGHLGILFEVDKPRPGMKKGEQVECKARLRLFRDIARLQGRYAYKINMDYAQPIVADASQYSGVGRKMDLVVIPGHQQEIQHLLKSDVEKLLAFILKVYATTQLIPAKKKRLYQDYLENIRISMINVLPDHVELEA